ncbi:hypothetical protein PVAP13_2KG357664 [Panicum virgatum]|uniref:Uncharacterized protein n=1 Tax=Panicum virgatum TaxID=38727 RepID=A0A8T0W725_PANVG|nr:hypothetical protein PVAP13_2KG357664 [Panicum virgatum]
MSSNHEKVLSLLLHPYCQIQRNGGGGWPGYAVAYPKRPTLEDRIGLRRVKLPLAARPSSHLSNRADGRSSKKKDTEGRRCLLTAPDSLTRGGPTSNRPAPSHERSRTAGKKTRLPSTPDSLSQSRRLASRERPWVSSARSRRRAVAQHSSCVAAPRAGRRRTDAGLPCRSPAPPRGRASMPPPQPAQFAAPSGISHRAPTGTSQRRPSTILGAQRKYPARKGKSRLRISDPLLNP